MIDTTTRPRPHEVDELLDLLVPSLRAALGARALGGWLWGSAVLGGYRPGRSDVDVLVVLEEEPDAALLAEVAPAHAALVRNRPDWEDRLEVAYAGRAGLASFREHPHPIVRVSPGEPLNLREADSAWLVDWYQVRHHGEQLFGEPGLALLPDVTAEELRGEAVRQVQGWAHRVPTTASHEYLSYIVLAVARGLHAVETGTQCSKQDAGTWLGAAHPQWAQLAGEAVRVHDPAGGDPAPLLTPDDVDRFVQWATAHSGGHG
ncbi:MAG: nucleotidyltransferase family protein [Thermoleophilia bacterium]|nr:nucleotidyltransferase family protein [Thermoleophilia bacterium]